jgi:hypothetical protein
VIDRQTGRKIFESMPLCESVLRICLCVKTDNPFKTFESACTSFSFLAYVSEPLPRPPVSFPSRAALSQQSGYMTYPSIEKLLEVQSIKRE